VGAARLAGVRPGPDVASLPIREESARAALASFRLSCPPLLRRNDASGLTRGADWAGVCNAAATWPDNDAPRFFTDNFETAVVGDGQAYATGYYEPEIAASRTRRAGYEVPIYRRPADLVEADLGLFSDTWKGKRIRGRVTDGKLVPYPDRAQIVAGALEGRGLELAWAKDEIEFFFLQVQGSGRLRLPDGAVMRIGYDSQNGRDYTGIGAYMRNQGLLEPGQASMQGIMAWLRAHPDQAPGILNQNKSFVFFREITGAGPPGALGVAVAGRTTVAADPAFVPLGAPVFLTLDRPEATGLWVAQDTGGAIKGANRFDTFWGAGDEARRIAGGMSGRGTAVLLLPRGTLSRLGAGGGGSGGAAARP
jgi:membrane-bound lytic murein transglycosylase A